MHYKQCILKKGNQTTTTWIPEHLAVVGEYVKIKDDGIWDDGWIVEKSGSISLAEDIIIQNRDDYRNQRKASDI